MPPKRTSEKPKRPLGPLENEHSMSLGINSDSIDSGSLLGSDDDNDEEFDVSLEEFQDIASDESDEENIKYPEETELLNEEDESDSGIQILLRQLLDSGKLDHFLNKLNQKHPNKIRQVSSRYCSPSDEEEDGETDRLENFASPNAQTMEQDKPIELKINDVPGGEDSFYETAALDTYFVHPWPNGNGARAACLDLLKRLHNEKSNLATVTPETVHLVWIALGDTLYSQHIKSRRTTLHQQVEKWLHHFYDPPMDIFPSQEIFNSKPKKFEFLAEDSRFARKHYLSTGSLLQNPMLVDCMRYIYLNDGGHMDRRISMIPDPVPKHLIVLIYVTILYKLAKFSKCALYVENTNAINFKENSLYHNLFETLVDENTPASRRVNWLQIQDMVRREMAEDISDGGWSPMRISGEY
ncbi:hypothetical protein BDA99DRAFT_540184 [Phascolomyces articulosus]|uniref:Uncharacterized protein n=1 Tax=Phascolomyces articulosus TaxID=60185 RepID=A0AAD5JUT6_9FUNG|nr:hypothetical protein BDA99DRAFT_540184 [Phascolomyces articulosus]